MLVCLGMTTFFVVVGQKKKSKAIKVDDDDAQAFLTLICHLVIET